MARFDGGWVKIRRKAMLGDINSNFTRGGLFGALVAMANMQDSTVSWRGRPRQLIKGEIVTSLTELASLGGVDRKTVKRHIDYLKDRGTLDIESSKHGLLIRLNNFSKYQKKEANGSNLDNDMVDSMVDGMDDDVPHIEERKNIRIQEGAGKVSKFPEDKEFQNLFHPTELSDLRLKQPEKIAEIKNLIDAAFDKEWPSIAKAGRGRFEETVWQCYLKAGLNAQDFRSDLNSLINESRATSKENPEGWRQYLAARIQNQSKAVLNAARAIS